MGEKIKTHVNGNEYADSFRIYDRKSIHYIFVS